MRFIQLKYYQIQIETENLPDSLGGIWYADKGGQKFNCCLVCKETASGFKPRFLVMPNDGTFPSFIRTIRPEDCRIIQEDVLGVPESITVSFKNYQTESTNEPNLKP